MALHLIAHSAKSYSDRKWHDELYRKEPMFYQHKPYNYYVSILEMYFPQAFDKLEKKYLPENL